jgi:hypothetical protein
MVNIYTIISCEACYHRCARRETIFCLYRLILQGDVEPSVLPDPSINKYSMPVTYEFRRIS